MERRCQNCGAEVSESAKFCRGCGCRIETIEKKSKTHPCPKCGKEILPGAKFCRHCGDKLENSGLSQVKPEDLVCPACGGALNKTSKFCRGCGSPVEVSKPSLKPSHPQMGISCSAPESPGESLFPATVISSGLTGIAGNPTIKEAVVYTGPIKILFLGGWHLFKGFFGALKSPKKLMPGILLGVVWLVISILPTLGITLPGQDIASWLTFSQGGLQGGTPGVLGGVLGKGVFAAALTGLFAKNPHQGNRVKDKNRGSQPRGSWGLMMIGMGLGLILYNFFTWDNSIQNSMVGLVAAMGTLRGMGREHGFLRRLVTALAQRFSPKKMASSKDTGILGAGLAAGFALSVPMSLIGGSATGYIIGITCLLPGAFIALRRKSREAVKSA